VSLQGPGKCAHPGVQLGIADAHRLAVLTARDQGNALVPEDQQIFGEIEGGALEPVGTGHFAQIVDHCLIRSVQANLGKSGKRLPEIRNPIHGSLVQLAVGIELQIETPVDYANKRRKLRFRGPLRRGRP